MQLSYDNQTSSVPFSKWRSSIYLFIFFRQLFTSYEYFGVHICCNVVCSRAWFLEHKSCVTSAHDDVMSITSIVRYCALSSLNHDLLMRDIL